MAELIFLLLNLIFVIYLLYYIVAFLSGAPFVPTTGVTAASMMELAGLKNGMTAYDLGSGDGKLLGMIAKRGAKAVGIEINPVLAAYSYVRFAFSPYRSRISIVCKSFWSVPFGDADVLFIYLLPLRMERLEKKLLAECRKNTVVVSNSFMFPHLTPIRTDKKNHVYLYKIP